MTPAKAAKASTKPASRTRAGDGQSVPSVGAVLLDVKNPFFAEVARGVEDAANDARCSVMLCNSDGSADKEDRYLQRLEDAGAAGAVIGPVKPNLNYLEMHRRRGLCIVLIDRPSPDQSMCSVAVDNVKGGTFAGRHLLGLGHERIGFVSGPRSIQQVADRLEGLRSAVAETGLDPDDAILEVGVADFSAQAGAESIDRLIPRRNPPTAVFCANDLLALGVMRAVAERGISVPDDLALIGYDDVEFASILQIPLTTIRQPKYALGSTAARLLLDEIENPDGHQHLQRTFSPELVVRASCGGRNQPDRPSAGRRTPRAGRAARA